MTLERGTLLHKRYRIVEILGQGGMGSVYRAVDENLGVEVAVKDNLFTTEEYARQFRLEAVILASLRHPNLPRVTDHFVIGEQGQYLVMDYIEGEDLRQRMERQGVLDEEDAILIGAAMCDALQYLHTRKPPIVHRDVKPGNVKITSEGHVYLVDFGLAKMVRGNQATTTGARAMTPGYSPPEQYGTARTDPRSDIYSLGATLYAALTGVIPEDGLARAMDNVELTPVRKRNPKISRRLAQAVERAMAVRPDDRFQTADEFKEALLSSNVRTQKLEGDIMVEPPPQATAPKEQHEPAPEKPAKIQLLPSSTPPPALDVPKRKTSPWVSFSLFLLAVLVALIALIFYRDPVSSFIRDLAIYPTISAYFETAPAVNVATTAATEEGTQPAASNPTATATSRPTQTVQPSQTPTPSLTPTPTQTLPPTATLLGGGYGEIAFVSNRTGIPQIFTMKADGSEVHQLTDIAEGACQPDWSPDGLRIVFTTPCLGRQDSYDGSHLSIINADGSGLAPISLSGSSDFDPDWSPDGNHIAFTTLQDGIPRINILNLNDSSVNQIVLDATITEARQPAWSPDGTQLVYTVKRVGVYQIWVMSNTGEGQTQLVRSGSEYSDFKPAWSPDGQVILFTQSVNNILAMGWLRSIRYDQRESQDASRVNNGSRIIDVAYSPDNQWIVFETNTDANYDIGMMRADGSGRVILTTEESLEFDPAWRPYK